MTLYATIEEKKAEACHISNDTDPLPMQHYLRLHSLRIPYMLQLVWPFVIFFIDWSIVSWSGKYLITLMWELTNVYLFSMAMFYTRNGVIAT